MNKIIYVYGDATAPTMQGRKIIAHVSNDAGRWGRGFVLSLSQRWRLPEERYREWSKSNPDKTKEKFILGGVQFVRVAENLQVANMIAQHGIRTEGGVPPIRYGALRTCLQKVAAEAARESASVHMPRIGCGLAGGEWSRVESIIEKTLVAAGASVLVYDLPNTIRLP